MIRKKICIIRCDVERRDSWSFGVCRSGDARPGARAPGARALRAGVGLARGRAGRHARSPARTERLESHAALHHQRGGTRCRRGRHVAVPCPRACRGARRRVARSDRRPFRRSSARRCECLPRVVRLRASAGGRTGLLVVRTARADPTRAAGSSRTPVATRPRRSSPSARSPPRSSRPALSSTRSRG